jgi:hypothetical protein
MSFPRILAAAVTFAALLAPTAVAKPVDSPRPVADMHASVALAAAAERHKQTPKQDLRSPDARDAATLPAVPWPAARQLERMSGLQAPTLNPEPSTRPAPVAAPDDDGVDWATIGIGVGLTFVALGAITGITHRIRMRQRPRIAG